MKLTCCPRRYVGAAAWAQVVAVERCHSMHLPLVAGGLTDQPSWFIEAVERTEPDRELDRFKLMHKALGPIAGLMQALRSLGR